MNEWKLRLWVKGGRSNNAIQLHNYLDVSISMNEKIRNQPSGGFHDEQGKKLN